MTIEAAKLEIERRRPGVPVKVYPTYTYQADCKNGTVCSFEPLRWSSERDEVQLFVNPTVTVTAPE